MGTKATDSPATVPSVPSYRKVWQAGTLGGLVVFCWPSFRRTSLMYSPPVVGTFLPPLLRPYNPSVPPTVGPHRLNKHLVRPLCLRRVMIGGQIGPVYTAWVLILSFRRHSASPNAHHQQLAVKLCPQTARTHF